MAADRRDGCVVVLQMALEVALPCSARTGVAAARSLVNVFIDPPTFQRNRRVLLEHPIAMVHGELEDEDGAIQVMAQNVIPLEPEHMNTPPSRDLH